MFIAQKIKIHGKIWFEIDLEVSWLFNDSHFSRTLVLFSEFFFYLNDLAVAAATIKFAYSFATERKHWHYKSFDYVIMCRRKNNGVFY